MTSNGTSSLREQILATEDIEIEQVPVKQWGVTVEVRGMTGNERAEYLEMFSNQDGKLDYKALYPALIILTVRDPSTGEPLFFVGDESLINTKSGAALDFLAKAALRLSGISQETEEEVGKDSSPVLSTASTSTSQSASA